jgi:hypothetical protein
MFGRVSQWNHLGLEIYILGVFKLQVQFPLYLQGYSDYLLDMERVLVVCAFWGIGPFHLSWNSCVWICSQYCIITCLLSAGFKVLSLVLVICVFFLFCIVCFATDLILIIFQTSRVLFHYFIVLFQFHWFLLIISFHLLALDLSCSFFLIC